MTERKPPPPEPPPTRFVRDTGGEVYVVLALIAVGIPIVMAIVSVLGMFFP